MDFELVRHPSSPVPPIDGIRASVERLPDSRLSFHYRLSGDISSLIMPALVPVQRADELWRTTCFEAFAKMADSRQYVEFNFSPSARWAAYLFDDYRAGMRDFEFASAPRFDMRVAVDSYELGVIMDLKGTQTPWREKDLVLGLSAVIETRDGGKSYWALAHPPGDAPDFHSGDCFTGLLRAPGPA